MKDIRKIENITDKEWEELASLLSDEKAGNTDLLNRYLENDIHNTGKQWKELRKMDGENEIDVDKAWNRVYSRLNTEGNRTEARRKVLPEWPVMLKIAAAALLVLTLGVSVVYLNNSDLLSKRITLATNNDQKNLQIDLPDGSIVFLNRNSVLSYRSNFGRAKREVALNGEAFFEIAPDKEKPFSLDAGKAVVKVVGTSFNVITSNQESAVEVFVQTGKVLLSDNYGEKSIFLDPGFIGTMDSKNSGKTVNTNPNYLSWNTGHLIYNGQKLDVVFNDLKRVYNMDIVADDADILDNVWTSPIDNQSQETIIRLICASFNLSYTKDGNVYHLLKN